MQKIKASPLPPPTEEGWWSRERALVLVLAGSTVIALYLCYRLFQPFLPSIAWALALAVVAWPVHARLASRLRYPPVAAAVSVTLIILVLVGPVLLVVHSLGTEAADGVEAMQNQGADGLRAALDRYPRLESFVKWIDENFNIEQELRRAVVALTADVGSLVTGSMWAIAQLLITLLALFFFFRDQPKILRAVRSLVPLSAAETDKVLHRVADTIHATVYGILMVAAIQGTLGGLMFWWLGMPAPLLWGVVMGVLAVIPWLGTFVVWAPAAAMLMLQGLWVKGLILTAWGLLAIGLIDNLLYPFLVGNRLRLHTLLAFFSLVGGLMLFGASGIVLGPMILSLTAALLEIWQRRTRDGRTAEEAIRPPDSGNPLAHRPSATAEIANSHGS
jgi:predicted PurR-regulated permease PerM